MSEITWSIPPNCSDRSLTAMEQAISAARSSISTCIRFPMSDGITSNPDSMDRWGEDDDVSSLVSTNVNPLAVSVFCGPPGSVGLNPKTKNAILLTEVRKHEKWNGILQMFDEVWVTPGSPFDLASSLVPPDDIRVVIPSSVSPSSLADLDIPSGDPTLMMHEEWDDARGVEAVVRAWLRNQDCKDGVLIVSMRSSHVDQTSALMTRIRMEEGRPRGSNRIFLMTSPSRRALDACLMSSDALVCAHVGERGWRPLAIKAAMCGKPIVSTNRGDITKHIGDCSWVETPDLEDVTFDTMDVAMEGMVGGINAGISNSLSSDAKPAVVLNMRGHRMMDFLRDAGIRLVTPGS